MIPPRKLQQLPRSQALRKTAKSFEEAEFRLLRGIAAKNELPGLAEALGFCVTLVSGEAGKALGEIHERLEHGLADSDGESLRRDLNTVHHLLSRELGRFPSEWDFDDSDTLGGLDPAKRRVFPGMVVYLEDIRSPFNVGAMFRTAESFGAEKILLSPFSADPEHPRAKRTAMGCTSVLPWSRTGARPFGAPDFFPPQTPLFALETGGTPLDDFDFPQKGVMIVGSEELGVSPEALAAAEASLGRLSIPTMGAKGSLNVSVAFGIVMRAWAENIQTKRNMIY